ncbi:protein phosphatase 1 regulatory subunit 35 isoform X1 [Ictalurus punctatus]|uniref:Protein phosphatase 1 regulatory subunit 35 isoform X1 n=1 Tax=Ictalurus punctatus TaxID=7998 RepID=A0A2D0SIJ8_ICTPU|nr:protein phosphatase 1 regulatory subunit 35 isoform X1 [Ictalurus punctatus]XP_047016520.1 protein phosphatase 1 regulatory subunit 35 isoform X1 [Ictalurus punctatus]
MDSALMQMSPPPLPRSPAPAPPQCPELDLSLTLTPERPGHSAVALNRGNMRTRPRQVRFAVSPDSSSDQPPVTMAITQHYSNQSAAEKRHRKGKQVLYCIKGPHTGEQGGMSAQSDGQVTEGVWLNTTLALKSELLQLEEAEFNSKKAVQERLQNSTTVQECVRTRVAEGLNFPRSHHLYRALVSVSLSHDELIAEALRDRPALALPTASHHTKSHSPPAEGPDLLFFYEPHCVVRETPLLPGNRIPLPHLRPAPRPAHTTFHLLQRHRQWEA